MMQTENYRRKSLTFEPSDRSNPIKCRKKLKSAPQYNALRLRRQTKVGFLPRILYQATDEKKIKKRKKVVIAATHIGRQKARIFFIFKFSVRCCYATSTAIRVVLLCIRAIEHDNIALTHVTRCTFVNASARRPTAARGHLPTYYYNIIYNINLPVAFDFYVLPYFVQNYGRDIGNNNNK